MGSTTIHVFCISDVLHNLQMKTIAFVTTRKQVSIYVKNMFMYTNKFMFRSWLSWIAKSELMNDPNLLNCNSWLET